MACNAFVLGGGGVLGAAEVGMARALLEAGVQPDLVCGTSVGAINGADIAADPTPDGAQRLLAIWDALAEDGILAGCLIRRVAEAGSCGTGCPRAPSRNSAARSSAWRPASKVPKSPGSTRGI